MSIVNLVKYISADVCKALVAANLIAATFSVTAATNATPIVITTNKAHLLYNDAIVTITGVAGNTAANDDWNVTVVTPTTFALNNSVGSGAYTSGGTVSVALSGGKILLGRQWDRQNQASPRIIFIPIGGDFPARDQYATATIPYPTDPQHTALSEPGVLTNRNVFEVLVWGASSPPDPDTNFTVTELLRDQVIRTADRLFRGNYSCKSGQWKDQTVQASADMKLGHLYSFQLTIDAPVTAVAMPFAPNGVGATIGIYFQPDSGGAPELAATIET
jgi:hypothetical protein